MPAFIGPIVAAQLGTREIAGGCPLGPLDKLRETFPLRFEGAKKKATKKNAFWMRRYQWRQLDEIPRRIDERLRRFLKRVDAVDLLLMGHVAPIEVGQALFTFELNRPGFAGGCNSCETGAMTNQIKSPKFSAEVRPRTWREAPGSPSELSRGRTAALSGTADTSSSGGQGMTVGRRRQDAMAEQIA